MSFKVEHITEVNLPENVWVVLKAGLEAQDEFSVNIGDDHIQYRYDSNCLVRFNRGMG